MSEESPLVPMCLGGVVTISPRPAPVAPTDRAAAPTLKKLAALLLARAPHDGRFALPVPGTYVVRLSHASKEKMRATVQPMLCVVAQGAKTVLLGREVFE